MSELPRRQDTMMIEVPYVGEILVSSGDDFVAEQILFRLLGCFFNELCERSGKEEIVQVRGIIT